MGTPFDPTIASALAALHAYGRAFPHGWADVARAIDRISRDKPPRYGEGIFCPTIEALQVMDPAGTRAYADWGMSDAQEATPEASAWLQKLSSTPLYHLVGLAAWRQTQGVYDIDPDLLSELLDTPCADVPGEALRRLPAWCVYVRLDRVERPDLISEAGGRMLGFWAFLNATMAPTQMQYRRGKMVKERAAHEAPAHLAEELVILLHTVRRPADDADDDAAPKQRGGLDVPIYPHLGAVLDCSIEDGVGYWAMNLGALELLAGNQEQAELLAMVDGDHPFAKSIRSLTSKLISVLLYLCADNADIPPQQRGGRIVRGKKRPLIPCAPAPQMIACGVRVGAALRLARSAAADRSSGLGGTVAPHVRRAHWHRYWTGRRDSLERTVRVRWLSPILVNIDPTASAPEFATVHDVTRESR